MRLQSTEVQPMFNRAQAISAVEEHLNRNRSEAEDALVVLEDASLEYDFGWVFFYGSKRHTETGRFEDMMLGNAPIIFEKATGRMIVTGTAEPIESYIEAYRKTGNPHSRPGASVRIWGWNEGAAAVEAIRVLRTHVPLGLAEAKQRIDEVLKGGDVTVATRSVDAAREAVLQLKACHFRAEQLWARPDPTEQIEIPGTLTVVNAAYALDGGSIMLGARDGTGVQHGILLVQHAFRDARSGERLPGRLYFDGKLLPIRSQAEKTLIRALRAAEIGVGPEATARSDGLARENALVLGQDVDAYLSAVSRGPIEATRHLVEDLASYVESEEYVKLAAEIESASIRSVLYLKAAGADRVEVMKILRQALRLSLDETKRIIGQTGAELARGSKLEIDRLRKKLVAAGATVEQIDQR